MLRCDWLSYYQAICFLPTSSILQKQLFLSPSWPLSKAEWAIDSEPIRARVIIVKYY